jgi:hypothetical protein
MLDEVKKEAQEILISLKRIRSTFVNEHEELQIRQIRIKKMYQEDLEMINNMMIRNKEEIRSVDETIAETERLINE